MAMLILASRSAARKALLSSAGIVFEAISADIDERAVEGNFFEQQGAGGVAKRLAEAKAAEVATRHPSAWVIGADQTLAIGGKLFHKPGTFEEAQRQLDGLRGRTHQLHSGVALARGGKILWSYVDGAELTLREFSPNERDEVMRREGEAILESVGGYRLEGPSVRLFESVDGDYFTILGLPLLPLLAALRRYAPETLQGFT